MDLLQATDIEPSEIEAENRESAEKEERQREVLDLQEQLMNILFPMRHVPGGVCPEMPREAMSGVIHCVKEELESSEGEFEMREEGAFLWYYSSFQGTSSHGAVVKTFVLHAKDHESNSRR